MAGAGYDLSMCRMYTKCKVCTLVEWNVLTFLRLHELALRENYEYPALLKWLNTEIERGNAMSPPVEQRAFITKQQLVDHFTTHVPMEEIVRVKAAAQVKRPDTQPFDPIVERKLQDLADHAAAIGVEDLDDFQRYHSTLTRMLQRFESLDKMFEGDHLPDKDLLTAYRSFGDSVGKMLQESIKMRQNERILQNAIESALQKMSLGSLQAIFKSIDRAAADLRPAVADADPVKADMAVQTLKEHVAANLNVNTKTALDHLKTLLRVA